MRARGRWKWGAARFKASSSIPWSSPPPPPPPPWCSRLSSCCSLSTDTYSTCTCVAYTYITADVSIRQHTSAYAAFRLKRTSPAHVWPGGNSDAL